MNNESIARVLASYEKLAPRIDDMVAGFYQRLFAADPAARALFKKDMTIQRQHLAALLAIVARNLPFQDVLEEPLMDLGAQHVVFGARPEQYPLVRDSILGSLGEALGSDWTPQLREDWTRILDHVAATMLRGATIYALRMTTAAGQGPA